MKESPYLDGKEHLIAKYGYLPLLGSSNKRYLEQLLEVSKLRFYDAGDTITSEGEHDHWAYIILEGEVTVSKHGETLATISRPGEVFGELTMIDNRTRSATIEAEKSTICLAIDINRVDNLTDERRDAFFAIFFLTLTDSLSSRLRAADEELAKLKAELAQFKK